MDALVFLGPEFAEVGVGDELDELEQAATQHIRRVVRDALVIDDNAPDRHPIYLQPGDEVELTVRSEHDWSPPLELVTDLLKARAELVVGPTLEQSGGFQWLVRYGEVKRSVQRHLRYSPMWGEHGDVTYTYELKVTLKRVVV